MLGKLLVSPMGGIWSVKRKALETDSKFMKKLYTFAYYLYQYENGSSINIVSDFKGIPCLPHDIKGIFVSGPAKIGKDCVIFHHVTINAINSPDDENMGSPVIGDNCYISTGAKIMGNARVGNNVRIGVNAVVTGEVPDNSVVSLLPSGEQVIEQKAHVDTNYYSYNGQNWIHFQDAQWREVSDKAVLDKLQKTYEK
ncbi:MAG: serine acetyltransferase [Epsilonproteobacteria bacterium]|nr:serine acetyltransferase [Campylobacterota bacterium]